MAYGNVLGYEPAATPGAYYFTQKDGPKVLLGGAAADDLKKKLDASASMMPQPTAMGPGTAPAAVPDTGRAVPGMAGSDVANIQGALRAHGVPVAAANPTSGAPLPQAAPAPMAAPAAPQPNHAVQEFTNARGDIIARDPNHPETIRVQTRGSAPTKGGNIERGSSVRGAFDPNEAYLKTDEELAGIQQKANMVGAQAAMAENEMKRGYIEEQQAQAKRDAAEAMAAKAAEDRGVAKMQARYDALEKDYTGARVDPGRASMPVLDALAAGMGAFAAILSKTPNYAQQVIDARIQRDIAAQEAAINVKGNSARNALGDLERQLGSRDLAKKAYESIATRQAQLQMEQTALSVAPGQIQANAMQTAAQLAQAHNDKKEAYRQASLGEWQRTYQHQQASAGSAPSSRLATVEEATALANLDKTRDAANKAAGPGKVSPRIQTKIADTQAAIDATVALDAEHKRLGRPGVHGGITDEGKAFKAKARTTANLIAAAGMGDANDVYDELTAGGINGGTTIAKSLAAKQEALRGKLARYQQIGGGGGDSAPDEAEGGGEGNE